MLVTSIGSPTRSQPWRQPIPIGPSEQIAAATTPSESTWSPWSWKVRSIFIAVAGAAADERDAGADDLVDAANHLLLVARSTPSVSSISTRLLGASVPTSATQAGGRGAGLAQAAGRRRARRGADAEARAAERGDDDAAVAGALVGDLAGGGAADQRGAAADSLTPASSSSRS